MFGLVANSLDLAQKPNYSSSYQDPSVLPSIIPYTWKGYARVNKDNYMYFIFIIAETYSTPTVLFTAKYLTTNHYSPGDVFVFPNIVSNIGEGYNQSSGYFTAPYTGVYIFTTTICSQRGKHVFAELIAANIKLEAIYTYNGDGNGACVSFSGVAKLSKGERAWVRGGGNTAYSGALHSGGSYRWPTFSGMLVHV